MQKCPDFENDYCSLDSPFRMLGQTLKHFCQNEKTNLKIKYFLFFRIFQYFIYIQQCIYCSVLLDLNKGCTHMKKDFTTFTACEYHRG